jgi:hypothetical protein
MSLRISKDLTLPLDAVTQTFLIVGKRGSGKTSTAVRLAEQFAHAGVPFVVLDPADVWWGLKASKDGKQPGLSIYVFGGRHGDLPLEPTAGALMADVVMEHRFPVVLSIKHFSGGERTRFVTDFAGRLYRQNTEPLHLFLEEAHEVAPQHPYKGEEPMLGAMQRIWKLGRSSGLGGSAITQRPASLNKNITTQAEVLIIHRTIGPQDVAAIREWIRYHGEREDVLAELATLKTGEAFVWAPDFPEQKPIGLQRVTILERETFDSSATPKAGERQREPKALAPVDLERLRSRMAATIERAKSEDPRELRRRIKDLEATLAQANVVAERIDRKLDRVQVKEKRIEVPVLKDAQVKRLETLFTKIQAEAERHGKAMALFWKNQDEVATALLAAVKVVATHTEGPAKEIHLPVRASIIARLKEPSPSRQSNVPISNDTAGIKGPEQRILDAIGWLESLGIDAPEQTAVAFLAGYKYGGGAFNNPKGRLRQMGHVEYLAGNLIRLTGTGRSLARIPEAALTTQELHARVMARLKGPEQRILQPLLDAYPNGYTNEALSTLADYSDGGGAYNNPRGRLRSMGLIEYRAGGKVFARDILFLERLP